MKRSWVLADGPPDKSKGKGKGGGDVAEESSKAKEVEMDMPAIVLTLEERHAVDSYMEKLNATHQQQQILLSPQVKNIFDFFSSFSQLSALLITIAL